MNESHFDARAELKNVRHLDDDEKELSQEDRLKLRRERLENIKKKLADQMIGIAKANAEFEDLIFSNNELTREELETLLEKSSLAYKLAPWQIEEYKAAIEKVVERKRLVSKFFTENCEGKTGEEIFEFIFGKKPHGKIVVEEGALSPVVFCDSEDFAYIHSLQDVEIVEGNSGTGGTRKSKNLDGFAVYFNEKAPTKFADFGGSFIVIRSIVLDNAISANEIITHENKHIFDTLVFPSEAESIQSDFKNQIAVWEENLEGISDEELNNLSAEDAVRLFSVKLFEMQIDVIRRTSEAMAAKEIVAYYKQGIGQDDIHLLLSTSHNGELYSVIDERTRQGFIDQLEAAPEREEKAIAIELFRKMHEQEEEVYKGHLYDALEAIGRLEEIGFPRAQIIGLFETEPLGNWKKIFERIKKSDRYQTKDSAHSLKRSLEVIEYEIESFRDTVAEAEEQLRRPSEKSELYKTWGEFFKARYETYKEYLKFVLEANKKHLENTLRRKVEAETMLAKPEE